MFVYYTYDEWGAPVATLTRYGTEEEQEIAEINPLRYRGYYYDSETGYYYLQSRYYNPEWGRFISPDSFDYIDNTTQLGCNAYVYCINSPIMYTDENGTKSMSSTEKANIKRRFDNYMLNKGYTNKYKLNSAINKNYDISKDSCGLYTVSCEYRISYNEYYNAIFIYGDTKAWSETYQDACGSFQILIGAGEGIAELIVSVLMLVIIIFYVMPVVFLLLYLLTEQQKNSLNYYNLSKEKGYYEYLQTFSHTVYKGGSQNTTYIVTT